MPDEEHPHRSAYRLEADRRGIHLSLDESFWNDAVAHLDTGTTYLDFNIAQVIQEIRAALYFVGTEGPRH